MLARKGCPYDRWHGRNDPYRGVVKRRSGARGKTDRGGDDPAGTPAGAETHAGKRSDILLSTLRKTVQVMGGNLSLVAEFPDRAPVVLSGIAELVPDAKPTRRTHVRA